MPTYTAPGVYVEIVNTAPPIQPAGTSTAGFIGYVASTVTMPLRPVPVTVNSVVQASYIVVDAKKPVLLTSFDQFKVNFGDVQAGNSLLAHAVYGFFQNGGTVCYVARTNDSTNTIPTGPAPVGGTAPTQPVPTGQDIVDVLSLFEGIDDISLVCVPGVVNVNDSNAVIDHCQKMEYRFAALDGNYTASNLRANITAVPQSSDNNFAALYHPWIVIPNLDPASSKATPTINQPPSGHVCGLIARVDGQTGPYDAPANEIVRGTAQLVTNYSKSDQQVLNPVGVNLIRNFHGAITLWGARTLADPGGNTGAFLYVNVQRTMSWIAQSIDEGTQFVVFKSNSQKLWGQVNRVVTAFLTDIWRDGALFGSKPEEAFYVKVDASNNPPELRALGQLIIEIGVSIVLPAEFVVFRIQQYTQIPTS